jgi:hypothetical protein
LDKRQLLKSVVEHTQAGRWDRALEECRQAAALFPDDAHIRSLVSGLMERMSLAVLAGPAPAREAKAATQAPPAPAAVEAPVIGDAEARSRALMEEAVRRRVERQNSGDDSMAAVMQSSRRISDVLHAATTKHMEEDVEALITAARKCLSQDLLPEALRLCQKVTAQDPENEQVKALLVEIYRRKGL